MGYILVKIIYLFFNTYTKNKYFGIDDIIKTLMRKKIKISKYLFNNYWVDVGQLDDYEIAKQKKK
jgi:NDP-sugar pyrophosphorylase family protein